MFNLLIVQAFYGDCLLLEYGASDRRRYLLIDGGPQGAYRAHLRPALEEIAGRGSKLDLVVLSHTDDDHVLGLVEMFGPGGDVRGAARRRPPASACRRGRRVDEPL